MPTPVPPRTSDPARQKAGWRGRTAAGMDDTFHALKVYPQFRRLWFAAFGFTLAQWMQSIALGWLAFDLTDSERFVGLIAFAAGCPFIVVSIPGGALLDRYDRRTVLLISQALAGIVAVCVAIDVLSGNAAPWHLVVAAFLNGSLQAIVAPSQQSLVPRLVEPHDLQNALGLMSAGGNMTRVFGPALSGILIAALGTGYPFVVQAAAVLVAFAIVFTTTFPKVAPSTNRITMRVISEGARIISSRPDLRELFLLSAIPSLLVFPYLSFLNVYAEEILNIGSQGLGLLLASSGIGAVIGGLMIASLRTMQGIGKRLYTLTAAYCIVMILFAAVPHLAIVLPSLVAAGLIGSYAFSGNNALLQQRITDDVRGRVMGTYLLTWGLMPIGALWMGEMGETWNIRVAILTGAILSLAVIVVLRIKSQALHLI